MNRPTRDNLKTVARALGDLCGQVVFLGGAVVDLYATDPAAPEPRPTMDVDCIIDISTRSGYAELEDTLRRKGFVNDRSQGAPLCRWIVEGIKVDVMPLRSDILGFANVWYDEGFRHTHPTFLGDGVSINLLDTPYFLATKLAALNNRGLADLRTSSDFDDIIYVFRNRDSVVSEILSADATVKAYCSNSIRGLLSSNIIEEAIAAVLDYGEPPGTRDRVHSIMQQIGSINNS
jgi:hypothetical protein